MEPKTTDQFNVAIVCASLFEAGALEALFDDVFLDLGEISGKHLLDENNYVYGRIGRHTVVLTQIPMYGKVIAAKTAFWLSLSFPKIRLCLVVGTGAGVPYRGQQSEIFLGDVLISEGLIQHDLGKALPGGVFLRKSGPKFDLPKPNAHVSSLIQKLRGGRSMFLAQKYLSESLGCLQDILGEKIITYPGADKDRLFASSYLHKHHVSSNLDQQSFSCECSISPDTICEHALLSSTCAETCCAFDSPPCIRVRHTSTDNDDYRPKIHYGWIASGDAYVAYGAKRDRIATDEGVIGFEWAGVGVWEMLPTIVISGVSNYGDGHRTEGWQFFASACASSCAKALLRIYNVAAERPSGDAIGAGVSHSFTQQLYQEVLQQDALDRKPCLNNRDIEQGS